MTILSLRILSRLYHVRLTGWLLVELFHPVFRLLRRCQACTTGRVPPEQLTSFPERTCFHLCP